MPNCWNISLPDKWSTGEISSVCIKTKMRDPSKNPDDEFEYVDVSSVSNESFTITSSTTILGIDAPSRARKAIESDDILYATVRPYLKRVAKVPLALNGQIASTGFCVVRADKKKASSDFLYYLLLTDQVNARIKDLQRGSSYPAVTDKEVTGQLVPLPPLSEQRSIAEVLSKIQEAIAAQQEIIDRTRELKKALMAKLFTEGLRGEPTKDTEIGPIPMSWKVVRLETVISLIDYGTSVRCDYDAAGHPVLRIPNIVDGKINVRDLKFGLPKKNELVKGKLISGDLLFVRTNGVKENAGRCAIFEDEFEICYFASYLIRVRLKTDLSPQFFNFYSKTDIGASYLSGKAERMADGKFNINTGTIKNVYVPIPSHDEQIEIANIVTKLDQSISESSRKKDSYQDLFNTMLHELMTGNIPTNPLMEA